MNMQHEGEGSQSKPEHGSLAHHNGHNHHEGHEHHDHHLHHAMMVADFRRRFWISLIVTIPILLLSPMIQEWLGFRETGL